MSTTIRAFVLVTDRGTNTKRIPFRSQRAGFAMEWDTSFAHTRTAPDASIDFQVSVRRAGANATIVEGVAK